MLVIILIIASVLASFYLVYSKSYEEQIIAENSRQTLYVGQSLQSFIKAAYKEVEDLAFNSDIISLETVRQTPVFVSALQMNDYFELLYALGINEMASGAGEVNVAVKHVNDIRDKNRKNVALLLEEAARFKI